MLQYISSEQLPILYGGEFSVPPDDGSFNANKWPQSKEERVMFEWVKQKCNSDHPNTEKNSNNNMKTTVPKKEDQSIELPDSQHVCIKPFQVCACLRKYHCHYYTLLHDLTAGILKKTNRIRLLVRQLTPKGRNKPTANRTQGKRFRVWSISPTYKTSDASPCRRYVYMCVYV